MSFQRQGALAPDYQPVRYPGSHLLFRGPATDIGAPHVPCLGGTETFGRFVPVPYPARLGAMLETPVTNLGVAGGGVDVLLRDGAIRAALATARAIVLQVPGAHMLSNRFYTVHPRRNDRFVMASPALRALYREVDFTEFHFTRHLLNQLKTICPDRFEIVRAELRTAWRARMTGLIEAAAAPVHLLWLSRRDAAAREPRNGLGEEPLFVTEDMLSDIADLAASLTVVPVAKVEGGVDTRGMRFAADERQAARLLPGPAVHEAVAIALLPRLQAAGHETSRRGEPRRDV